MPKMRTGLLTFTWPPFQGLELYNEPARQHRIFLVVERDAGFLDIDPAQTYDDDDYVDTRKRRENPYAV